MKLKADQILIQMARTFKAKNTRYGDNWSIVGKVFVALYPDGLTLKTEEDWVLFHWMSWKIGKLTRFTQTGHTHLDSIHDDAVYTAMIEAYLRNNTTKKKDKKKQ